MNTEYYNKVMIDLDVIKEAFTDLAADFQAMNAALEQGVEKL